MKPLLLLMSFLFLQTETDPPQIEWQVDRKLEWSDFKRRAGADELFKAFSYTGISYIIEAPEDKIEITVTPYFLPKESWVHISYLNDELLNHEQGHFDITAIYARMLKSQLRVYETDVDYFMEHDLAKKIEAIFQVVFTEMDECQDRYDSETVHGTQTETQANWNNWFNQKLGRLNSAVHHAPE
jgi:hypothetical protein